MSFSKPYEDKIINFLKENGTSSLEHISRELDVLPYMISIASQELIKQGKVEIEIVDDIKFLKLKD